MSPAINILDLLMALAHECDSPPVYSNNVDDAEFVRMPKPKVIPLINKRLEDLGLDGLKKKSVTGIIANHGCEFVMFPDEEFEVLMQVLTAKHDQIKSCGALWKFMPENEDQPYGSDMTAEEYAKLPKKDVGAVIKRLFDEHGFNEDQQEVMLNVLDGNMTDIAMFPDAEFEAVLYGIQVKHDQVKSAGALWRYNGTEELRTDACRRCDESECERHKKAVKA